MPQKVRGIRISGPSKSAAKENTRRLSFSGASPQKVKNCKATLAHTWRRPAAADHSPRSFPRPAVGGPAPCSLSLIPCSLFPTTYFLPLTPSPASSLHHTRAFPVSLLCATIVAMLRIAPAEHPGPGRFLPLRPPQTASPPLVSARGKLRRGTSDPPLTPSSAPRPAFDPCHLLPTTCHLLPAAAPILTPG
jgi:hypothetical protein